MWLLVVIAICVTAIIYTATTVVTLIEIALYALSRENPRYAVNAVISTVLIYVVIVTHMMFFAQNLHLLLFLGV